MYIAIKEAKHVADEAIKDMKKKVEETSERIKTEAAERIKRDAESNLHNTIAAKQADFERIQMAKEATGECRFWKAERAKNNSENSQKRVRQYCGYP